jgi:hypothetical protein
MKSSWHLARTWLAVAAAAVLFTSGVSAHHGWGGYQDQQFELTGTLETDVNLGGPHATARIKAADGQVWNVVLAPGTRTQRTGLKEGVIPLGSKVTASGHRHRDPKTFEIKTEKLTWNGKVFDVYPDRDS